MEKDEQEAVTEGMNRLAAEIAALDANDPRRAEIIKELSRLSLLSASAKEQNTDGFTVITRHKYQHQRRPFLR
jgi:hypothetical protein